MTQIDENAPFATARPLSSVFSADCVLTIAGGTKKPAAIRRLVEQLAAGGKLLQPDIDPVVGAIIDRERLGTTGMGKGIAIPHHRTEAVADSVGAIGIAPDGIDFESVDGLPTRMVILLLSPLERRREHAELLGRIARLLCDQTLQYRVQIPRSAEELFSFLGFG
jgi:mannitol/fructose-specific phosphotransferase system IIA component (Ntr-type)